VFGVGHLVDEDAGAGLAECVGAVSVGTVGDEVAGVVGGGVAAVALVVFGTAEPGDGFGGVGVWEQWRVRAGVVEDVVVGVLDPVAGPTDGDEVVDVVLAALSTGFDVVCLERAVVLEAALAGVAVEFEGLRTEVVPVIAIPVPIRVVAVSCCHEFAIFYSRTWELEFDFVVGGCPGLRVLLERYFYYE
jgi:hypothetical protein